jgi:hypothetical protein
MKLSWELLNIHLPACMYKQGWIYWGGGVHPLALGRGGAIFHDKAKKY